MLDEFSDDKEKLQMLLTGRRVDLAEESSKFCNASGARANKTVYLFGYLLLFTP